MVIRIGHLVERDAAVAGVFDLRANGGLLGGGADRAGDEPRLIGRAIVELVARLSGHLDGCGVDRADKFGRQFELCHADGTGAECIGFNDVGPGCQVIAMDSGDFVRVSKAKNISKVFEVFVMRGKPLAADAPFVQAQRLDLRTHRAI